MAAPAASPRLPLALARTLLVVATLAAYANTFSAPFVFDDVAAVTQNPSLKSFITALSPPPGLSVTGRPLANLSLALNHAISGESVWSYHALNLALHLGNTLLLFALLRHSLVCRSPARESEDLFIPFAAATLWALHPLQTATVTYVMQRTELLAACATLLSLFAFTRLGPRWHTLSVLTCALGMTAKETAVVIPVLILLYDRTFISLSFSAALRARPRTYAALAGTWLILAALVLGTDNRGASAGLAASLAWPDYLLTQLWAIPHYLRLTLWPNPLVFDYGTATFSQIIPILLPAVLVVTALIATAIALYRRPIIGFLGAVFFLLLAPTSLVPIATQTVAEHRIYLALIFPVLLLSFALRHFLGRRAPFILAPLALTLAATTFARNTHYRSAAALWSDTVEKRPGNPRAHYNLAVHLLALPAPDHSRAVAALTETLRLDPAHPLAPAKLGTLLVSLGRFPEAIAPLESALGLTPASAPLHYQLAAALLSTGRTADALPHLAEAVRLNPTHAPARANFGRALAETQHYAEALIQFDAAARLDPADASSRANATRIRDYLRTVQP